MKLKRSVSYFLVIVLTLFLANFFSVQLTGYSVFHPIKSIFFQGGALGPQANVNYYENFDLRALGSADLGTHKTQNDFSWRVVKGSFDVENVSGYVVLKTTLKNDTKSSIIVTNEKNLYEFNMSFLTGTTWSLPAAAYFYYQNQSNYYIFVYGGAYDSDVSYLVNCGTSCRKGSLYRVLNGKVTLIGYDPLLKVAHNDGDPSKGYANFTVRAAFKQDGLHFLISKKENSSGSIVTESYEFVDNAPPFKDGSFGFGSKGGKWSSAYLDDVFVSAIAPPAGECIDGRKKWCPKVYGVCRGTTITCTNGKWPVCNDSMYLLHNPEYEQTETKCDGLDNDCDFQIDEEWVCIDKNRPSFDGWRVIPIRWKSEFDLGLLGGETEQIAHGFARCQSNPKIIYFNQDVAGLWKSVDGGHSWQKTEGFGLVIPFGQSIEVDPEDCNVVYSFYDNVYNYLAASAEGLYRSTDRGAHWERVLAVPTGYLGGKSRIYKHNIAYDPTSIKPGVGAFRWYAVVQGDGDIYRSENRGTTWSKIYSLNDIFNESFNISSQGDFNRRWPPENMFDGDMNSGSVLSPINGFKVIINFFSPKDIDKIELYQSDYKSSFDIAKGILIEFDNGAPIAYNLSKLPGIQQNVTINRQQVRQMNITITSVYESSNQSVDWGGFREIILFGNGKKLLIDRPRLISEMEIDPINGSKIYVSTELGLFCSKDGAKTFAKCGNFPDGEVSSIEINQKNPNIIYAVLKGKGLYVSYDEAKTFSLLRSGLTEKVFLNPSFPDRIYLIFRDRNIEVSQDGGKTWITQIPILDHTGSLFPPGNWKKTISYGSTGVVPNPKDPDEAVVFSHAAVYKTIDGGRTFRMSSTLFTGFAPSWWMDTIAFDPLNKNRFMTFDNDVGPVFTNTTADYFEVRSYPVWTWLRKDISWTGAYSGDFQPVKGSNTIVASVGDYWRTQLMRTTNAGKNWTLVTTGPGNLSRNLFVAFHRQKPNIVYAGGRISYDAGATFKPINFGKTGSFDIVGMCLTNSDIVYAVSRDGLSVLRSDDAGQTWRDYGTPTAGVKLTGFDSLPTFAIDPVGCNKVYGLLNGDLAVYNGTSWKPLNVLKMVTPSYRNFIRGVAVDPSNPNIIYAESFVGGENFIFRSLDGGQTWQNISYNFPRMGAQALKVNPHTGELFLGSNIGMWIFPSTTPQDDIYYSKAISRPSCYDGIQNGKETGIDSGPVCDNAKSNLNSCTPGQKGNCLLQKGVCAGSKQTCSASGIWPGCSAADY
ncbi:hypothetical protein D6829_02485, partial [Candidatus Pacearchaeota archaeon]